MIFNLYSQEIFREALEKDENGVLVNDKPLNNIRYDDTVIFADSLEGLQQLMNKVNEVSKRYGLKMTIKKFMVIRRKLPTIFNQ